MSRVDFPVESADRLDRVVAAGVPELSRRRARVLIADGAVYLDGKRCKVASRTAQVGARITVHIEDVAPPPPLPILHEDEHIVVVNKPAGLSANESETSSRASVVRSLGPQTKIVHRLDLDTTGVMVLARSPDAAAALSARFRAREVNKRYAAITLGVPPEGWVDAPIGPDPRRPRSQAVREDGRAARTEVAVRGRRDGLGAVELTLETGRTHQIRVHLSHLGTPILGDTQYGGKVAVSFEGESLKVTRPLLHAAHLEFELFGTSHAFEAPLPPDIEAIWRRLLA